MKNIAEIRQQIVKNACVEAEEICYRCAKVDRDLFVCIAAEMYMSLAMTYGYRLDVDAAMRLVLEDLKSYFECDCSATLMKRLSFKFSLRFFKHQAA